VVKINYQGRFGNNLFQFAVARVISDNLNLRIENPLQQSILPYDERGIPEDEGDRIVVDGFFQTPAMVGNFQNLNFSPVKEKGGTFVHVRLGDLLENHSQSGNRFASADYYRKALQGSSSGYISSDSPDDPIIKELCAEFNLELCQDSPENTIKFGAAFSKKVLSLGTFSWWIGFLGNQKEVICPNPLNFPKWHGNIFPPVCSFLNWKCIDS
jgi:hypothetical protein